MKTRRVLLIAAAFWLGVADLACGQRVKVTALETPRPDYPRELSSRGIGGKGAFALHVDRNTGLVSSVGTQQSTGVARLDACAVHAFERWRFKAPVISSTIVIPITFRPGKPPIITK